MPSVMSFEETYKTAYSHGLEVIYSLENVDLKTIRRIEENAPLNEKVSVESQPINPNPDSLDMQQELDLGEDFRNWVEPYFMNEPIQVLGLSFQAEACLIEHGIKKLSQLLEHNFRDYVFMKGMGQGHIDEVKKKLDKYIGNRSQKHAHTIDFKSLILSISLGIGFKKLSLYLKHFQLANIVPLSHTEKIEIKSFDFSKDDNLRKDVTEAFHSETRRSELMLQLEKIAKVFIIPWMRSRGGIATEDEIIERIDKVSDSSQTTQLYLDFISQTFTQGEFPFSSFLYRPEEKVYCSSKMVEMAYRDILNTTFSYFYKSENNYSLPELTRFLLKEFCKQWKDYSEELIRECINRSHYFDIIRAESGKLRIVIA
jgi:hypothetical protein